MTTSIHYDRMAGLYAALINDQIVGAAETYHDAEVLICSIREAHYSAIIGGDPLLIEAQRFGKRGSICAACVDQAHPCAVCEDTILCPTCGSPVHCDCASDQPEECYVCGAAAWERIEHGPLCPDHMGVWQEWQHSNTPLLAQCAAVIDACLGGPVANGGILDELRRVRAELKKAGW